MSLPFVRAAKEKYKVFVCCQPSVVAVFRTQIPDAQIIPWRAPWLDESKKYAFSTWKRAGVLSLILHLRKIKPAVAVTVWADTRSHLLMALSGASERISFPMAKKNVYASQMPWRQRQIAIGKILNFFGSLLLLRPLLTRKIDRRDYLQHHVESWRQLAEALQLSWNTKTPWLAARSVSLPEELSQWLRTARSEGKKIWLLHPGARTPNRRWPLERFRQLLEDVFVASRIPVIIINPSEMPLPAQWSPGPPVYRPPDLNAFFGILNEVDYVVCNDTGVAHAAAALGKRVISIFSANRPEWFAPYGNINNAVRSETCPHLPCLDRCVMPSFVCLEAVTVAMVKAQLQRHLKDIQSSSNLITPAN